MKHALFILFSLVGAAASAFTVVKDGIPQASIQISQDADAVVKYAAEELQRHIRLISGGELPIVSDAQGSRIRIAVNPTGFDAKLERLKGTDGYAVAESPGEVTLFAACSKGVLNGVYRYLRKNTDIIWARPDESIGTIYSQKPTLDFNVNDILDIPVFTRRGWQMGGRLYQENEIWQNRMCNNWSAATRGNPLAARYGNISEWGAGHNLNHLFITEKQYFDEHPDFFPLINGKRKRPSDSRSATQLCFSNQPMTDEFIRILDGYVKANPQHDVFRVLIEDNNDRCRCDACETPITLPDGSKLLPDHPAFYSTRFFIFMNKLADFMEKNHPGKKLFSFAYFFTEIPPKIPVKNNVIISYAPIGKDTRHGIDHPANKQTQDYVNNWLAQTNNIIWREYYGLTSPFPRPTWKTAADDFKSISARGIVQTYSELKPDIAPQARMSWDANVMSFWMLTALQWEPQNADALEQEFLSRAFGPAAADMKQYYDTFAESWFKRASKSTYRDSAVKAWNTCVYKAGLEDTLRRCLDRAEAKISHPKQKKLLKSVRDNFEFFMDKIENCRPTAVRTQKAIVFDPDFASAPWNEAVTFTEFTDRGALETPAKMPTELRVLYDDTNIYIGVKCIHPKPAKMPYRKHVETKKDNLFPQGEGFEVYIQGNWEKGNPFTQLVVDPANNRYAAVHSVKWQSQAQLTKTGWSGMLTIPWHELNLKSGAPLKAAFIRQTTPSPRPGTAPSTFIATPGSIRHNRDGLVPLIMK